MWIKRIACIALICTALPIAHSAFAAHHSGPDDLASDLRHHQVWRLVHFLGPHVLINDRRGRLIGIVKRSDVVHAFRVAEVVRVLNVGLACVDVRTKKHAGMPIVYDNGQPGYLRASSYFAIFTFSQSGAVAGLIFANYKDATDIC